MAQQHDNRQARYLHLTAIERLNEPWEADCVFQEQGGSIGRGNQNDFVLPEERVSRHHAMISYENGEYFLTDQNSANGTFVNDSTDSLEPGQAYRISDDDRLRIGDCLVVAKLVPAGRADGYEELPEMEDLPGNANRPDWFPGGEELEPEVASESSWDGIAEERPPVSAMKQPMPQPHPVSDVPPAAPSAQRISGTTVPTGFIPQFRDTPEEQLLPDSSSMGAPNAAPEPAPVTDPSAAIPSVEAAPGPPHGERAVPHPALGPADEDLLAALLRGLGSSALQVPPEKAMEFATQAGQLVREAIKGLIKTLHQRNDFKSSYSIPMTRIMARENNVFKYSANVDDALPRVFSGGDSAYLGPRESAQQAFQDIAADYVALAAGMEAAVGALLERFSPQVLEERIGKVRALDGVVPQIRQARLWEQFEKEYALIKEQAKEDFARVFGQHFEQAYTDKIRQLHSAGFGRRQDPES